MHDCTAVLPNLTETKLQHITPNSCAVGQAVGGDLPEEDPAEAPLRGPVGLEGDRLGVVASALVRSGRRSLLVVPSVHRPGSSPAATKADDAG